MEKIVKIILSINALGKAPHLHYSIVRLIPKPYRIDQERIFCENVLPQAN